MFTHNRLKWSFWTLWTFPLYKSWTKYLVQIQKNTDQKKLRTWTLFTQCGLNLNRLSKKSEPLRLLKSLIVQKTDYTDYLEKSDYTKNTRFFSITLLDLPNWIYRIRINLMMQCQLKTVEMKTCLWLVDCLWQI